eukprot:10865947-Ditylum_brightwellii.AAC.1
MAPALIWWQWQWHLLLIAVFVVSSLADCCVCNDGPSTFCEAKEEDKVADPIIPTPIHPV